MAKSKAGDHANLAPYPDDPKPALDLLLGHLNGTGAPDSKDVIHAAWHLAGYGASQFDPHTPPDPGPVAGVGAPCDKTQLAAHLEKLKAECDGTHTKVGAFVFPWATVLQMLLVLIQQLLTPTPAPTPPAPAP